MRLARKRMLAGRSRGRGGQLAAGRAAGAGGAVPWPESRVSQRAAAEHGHAGCSSGGGHHARGRSTGTMPARAVIAFVARLPGPGVDCEPDRCAGDDQPGATSLRPARSIVSRSGCSGSRRWGGGSASRSFMRPVVAAFWPGLKGPKRSPALSTEMSTDFEFEAGTRRRVPRSILRPLDFRIRWIWRPRPSGTGFQGTPPGQTGGVYLLGGPASSSSVSTAGKAGSRAVQTCRGAMMFRPVGRQAEGLPKVDLPA